MTTEQLYAVEVNWSWGTTYGFSEVERFVERDVSDAAIKQITKELAARIAKRYCYDCGRKDHPLIPRIRSVDIRPVGETRHIIDDALLGNEVFDAVYDADRAEYGWIWEKRGCP